MTLQAHKDSVRKTAFAARKAAHDLGQGHAGHLSSVLAGYRGVPLAGYAQMRTEIDPTPALEEAAAHGPVCLPVIEAAAQPLKFRAWSPDCAAGSETNARHRICLRCPRNAGPTA